MKKKNSFTASDSMPLLAKNIVSQVLRLPKRKILEMPLSLRHKLLKYATQQRKDLTMEQIDKEVIVFDCIHCGRELVQTKDEINTKMQYGIICGHCKRAMHPSDFVALSRRNG